jgi:sterol desaturase/sphingolipid hydroxylase (fatty acid hydroxylase superfamily)
MSTAQTGPSGRPEFTAAFRAPGLTLGQAARLFMRHRNARILVPAAATAVAARTVFGRWSRHDAKVAATLVAAEPFVEWMIHVHVLHQRPRTVRGRTIDSITARKHRAHHADPRDPDLVFIVKPVVLPLIAGLVVINVLATRSTRPALTGIATSLVSLTAYEWTHFLIHSSYRPKTALYRTLRRTHQLHHFRNENYWFGIITPVSDHVLNTYPAKQDVPPSPTAKTLGVGAARVS